MSFFKIIDFSIMPILLVWIGLFIFLNFFGFFKKKSLFNLVPLVFSIVFLVIHIIFKSSFSDGEIALNNIGIDFCFVIISIALYIFVDEIESRRGVISEVFENRYKNRRKK